jgi:hypothetical protein
MITAFPFCLSSSFLRIVQLWTKRIEALAYKYNEVTLYRDVSCLTDNAPVLFSFERKLPTHYSVRTGSGANPAPYPMGMDMNFHSDHPD